MPPMTSHCDPNESTWSRLSGINHQNHVNWVILTCPTWLILMIQAAVPNITIVIGSALFIRLVSYWAYLVRTHVITTTIFSHLVGLVCTINNNNIFTQIKKHYWNEEGRHKQPNTHILCHILVQYSSFLLKVHLQNTEQTHYEQFFW